MGKWGGAGVLFRCSRRQTFGNGRIGEIRPLILWGLGGLFCEAFCNTVDQLVGVVEHPLGVDREAALEEQVVVDLTQLLPEFRVADRFGLLAASKAEEGGAGRPESKRNSRALVHATFS